MKMGWGGREGCEDKIPGERLRGHEGIKG